MPLPPYIRREGSPLVEDRQRYQTVFARQTGAVAAPTAGLHFTPELLVRIRALGVDMASVTLHVGHGTFAPVRATDIRDHQIHAEYVSVGGEAAARINRAREDGHAVWPVGTTTVRSLEWACDAQGRVQPREGWCDLYIYPGYEFRLVDRLITNFHLPKSSLLFLVSALAGRDRVMQAYAEAVRARYRFFSYGDAMVVAGKS
jgi:S-adenosylmethionine:tRNA ribosyltransferase-isomerase